MVSMLPHGFGEKVGSILGAIKSTGVPASTSRVAGAVLPFVTFSQLPGAGGKAVAMEVARRLNAVDPGERSWEVFDREMIEKITENKGTSRELVESLEESSHTWLTDFFAGMSHRDRNPSDLRVLHEVAGVIRGLAQAGRVVLGGWGAGYITHGMPGGIHVWLVARPEDRTANLASELNLDRVAADHERAIRDSRREGFYKAYWPQRPLSPDQFTLTLNASLMNVGQMAEAVVGAVMESGYVRPSSTLTA